MGAQGSGLKVLVVLPGFVSLQLLFIAGEAEHESLSRVPKFTGDHTGANHKSANALVHRCHGIVHQGCLPYVDVPSMVIKSKRNKTYS